MKRAIFVLVLAVAAACTGSSPEEHVASHASALQAQSPLPGNPNPPLVCGDCIPAPESPQGGYKTCYVPSTGADRQVACTPPAPPPPPTAPPAPTCTRVTENGVCHLVCCSTVARAQRCSARVCPAPSVFDTVVVSSGLKTLH